MKGNLKQMQELYNLQLLQSYQNIYSLTTLPKTYQLFFPYISCNKYHQELTLLTLDITIRLYFL